MGLVILPSWQQAIPTTNLILWYSSRLLALTPPANIASWPDGSGVGSGKTLTQATSTKQSILTAGQQNGYPAAIFDGSDDWLAESAAFGSGSFSLFLVARGTMPGSVTIPLDNCGADPNGNGGLFVGLDNRGGANGTASWTCGVGTSTGGYRYFGKNSSYPGGTWCLVAFRWQSSGTFDYWLNGVRQTSLNSYQGSNGSGTWRASSQAWALGATNTGSLPAGLRVAEVLVYSPSYSDADHATVSATLNSIYNLY